MLVDEDVDGVHLHKEAGRDFEGTVGVPVTMLAQHLEIRIGGEEDDALGIIRSSVVVVKPLPAYSIFQLVWRRNLFERGELKLTKAIFYLSEEIRKILNNVDCNL